MRDVALCFGLLTLSAISVCTLFTPVVEAQSYTETHYVCSSGNGAGLTDGTSWANCFDGFSDIAWDGETEDSDDNEVGPNDKLELRDDDGVYREQLTVGASGLSGKPITIGVESGDSPIISGADIVSTWSDETGNVWSAALATEPNQVFFDETRGTEETGACPGDLNVDQEWCWVTSTLYQYSTSDPDTRYTSPGTEASQRAINFLTNSKANILVKDLKIIYSNEAGIAVKYGASTNCTFQNIDLASNALDGISFAIAASSTIRNSNIYDNGNHGIQFYDTGGGNIAEHNTIHDNCVIGVDKEQVVFQVGQNGDIVRYNYLYGQTNRGIVAQQSSNNQVYYNIIDQTSQNQNAQAGLQAYDATNPVNNNLFYNNTVYADDTAIFKVGVAVINGDGNVVKNNIFSGDFGTTIAIDATATNTVSDYNVFDPDSVGTNYKWQGTSYNFSDWKTQSSQDANSTESDPLFVDAAGDDFHLVYGSPAIDAGTDVSLTQDYEGKGVPFGLVDIGAYETIIAGRRR